MNNLKLPIFVQILKASLYSFISMFIIFCVLAVVMNISCNHDHALWTILDSPITGLYLALILFVYVPTNNILLLLIHVFFFPYVLYYRKVILIESSLFFVLNILFTGLLNVMNFITAIFISIIILMSIVYCCKVLFNSTLKQFRQRYIHIHANTPMDVRSDLLIAIILSLILMIPATFFLILSLL